MISLGQFEINEMRFLKSHNTLADFLEWNRNILNCELRGNLREIMCLIKRRSLLVYVIEYLFKWN